MKITADVRKYAPEHGIAEERAPEEGMDQKSKKFVNKGANVYVNAYFGSV